MSNAGHLERNWPGSLGARLATVPKNSVNDPEYKKPVNDYKTNVNYHELCEYYPT